MAKWLNLTGSRWQNMDNEATSKNDGDNSMKKLFALLMTAALLLGLAACGGGGEDYPTSPSDIAPAQSTAPTGKLSMFSYLRQRLSFNMDSSVTKVMNAIKVRDIQALESLMCLNIRENEENLPDKIGELIDAIDGEINDYAWSRGAGHEASSGDGRLLDQEDSGIRFETTDGIYAIRITWEIANNFAPEELGIRAIYLWRIKMVEYQGGFYERAEELVIIKATEGVGKWHD